MVLKKFKQPETQRKIKTKKMKVREQRNWFPHIWLLGMKNGITTLKPAWKFL